jgi:hypothetical protein
MTRETHTIGNVFFPGLECRERYSTGNLGCILIGGDRGDVRAASAFMMPRGVVLEDVEFLTTLDLKEEEVEDEVREVVQASYDSIQWEAFCQSKKNEQHA